jgi:hypothetical protein
MTVIRLGKKFSLLIFFLFIPVLLFAKHEGEKGYCALCDTKIFSPKEEGSFYLIPNEEYSEVWFLFSNKTKAKVGFCKKHAKEVKKRLTQKTKHKIMEGIKNGWEKEFDLNQWSKKQIEEYKKNFFSLEVTRRLKDEEIPD